MTQLRDLVRREPKRGLSLPRWLDRLASVGIVATDPQVVRRQRCVNIAAYFGVISGLSYIVITSLHDWRGLLPLNAYNAVLIVFGLTLPHLHRLGENFGGLALIMFVSFGQTYVIWMLGLNSSLHVFLLLAGAGLFFFGIKNWKLFAVVFLYILVVLLLALDFAPANGLLIPDDTHLREMMTRQTLINVALINAALIFYALSLVQLAEHELESQYERSEALIGAVMPAAIAARLKTSDARIADRIGNLNVLFADLVGFTAAAHDLAPEAVVGFLDDLVRRFDALAERFHVEKIKTVGDCYMAVSGLDNGDRTASIAIGRFALAMLREIAARPPFGGQALTLRIGIHCGPATAGVIGDTRFSYDVWGDAVNVASRMESQGLPGRIQVSDAFRALTCEAFTFEPRGSIAVKGIGVSETYFLTGERKA